MLSFLSFLFLLVSCNPVTPEPEPVPEPVIRFSDTELIVSPEGGDAALIVSASATWSVATDGQAWYSLASSSQIYAGESILKVTAEPNYTSSARKASFRN